MDEPLRAVIFDLDGVLADSEPWWNKIDAKLLAEYGVDYHGEYHREVLGVSYRLAVEFYKTKFGISVPTEELVKRRGEIAIGTSARPFLDRHHLTRFFDVVVAGDEIERGKPEPDIYLSTAEKLGLRPNECLVVEDSLSGIAAAKAAKMRVAAIPDRRFVDPREYEKKADFLLNDLADIPALVRSSD
ncbi:MAG: hypothetical protein DME63_03925 [Verrucomicrobia bacterium]|nr:MAG: hypothetical protein DME63_03925 [Verrucomicrobiota bacterium]